jgi:hypothetical protein
MILEGEALAAAIEDRAVVGLAESAFNDFGASRGRSGKG